MTLTPSIDPQNACEPDPLEPTRATPGVTECTLAISGLRVVLTERGARQTLEIEDADGELLNVISDSSLDPSMLRGSWRGVRDGQPWALAVGRSGTTSLRVTFAHKRRHLPGRSATSDGAEVAPQWFGGFWLAEAATMATRVSVRIDDGPTVTGTLEQL